MELLKRLAKELPDSVEGEVWECGVYLGGSAKVLQELMPTRRLRLFDTFGPGIPVKNDKIDSHNVGDFSISTEQFQDIVNHFADKPLVSLHKGKIPETFTEEFDKCKIAFLHIDLDQYQSYLDTLDFCVHKMSSGGIVVFDDYAASTCPGATKAVDEWIANTGYKLNKKDGNHQAWAKID